MHRTIDNAVADHTKRKVAQRWNDALMPSGHVWIQRLQLQAAYGERHYDLAVRRTAVSSRPKFQVSSILDNIF